MDSTKYKIAQELTILFKDETDIPDRFKKNSVNKTNKYKKDSLIENTFKEHVAIWLTTIDIIFENLEDENLAWRFIKLMPKIDKKENSVTNNEDFIKLTEYLIIRRDIKKCDSNELGNLCALHTAFQQTIENKLNNEK